MNWRNLRVFFMGNGRLAASRVAAAEAELALAAEIACRLADDKAALVGEVDSLNGQLTQERCRSSRLAAEVARLSAREVVTEGVHERNCHVLSEQLAEVRKEKERLERQLCEQRGEGAKPVLLRSLGGLK